MASERTGADEPPPIVRSTVPMRQSPQSLPPSERMRSSGVPEVRCAHTMVVQSKTQEGRTEWLCRLHRPHARAGIRPTQLRSPIHVFRAAVVLTKRGTSSWSLGLVRCFSDCWVEGALSLFIVIHEATDPGP